jgi:hypothetical protein
VSTTIDERFIIDFTMIVVGALAYRSATYIFGEIRGGFAARLAIAFRGRLAREFLKLYVITGLPIAFVNGFLIRFSWIDGVIVGIGTWIGTFAAILLARRFNPVIQFYFFAGVNLVWLGVNAIASIYWDG